MDNGVYKYRLLPIQNHYLVTCSIFQGDHVLSNPTVLMKEDSAGEGNKHCLVHLLHVILALHFISAENDIFYLFVF